MTRTLVDADLIKRAVTLASRAPSLHNSQPWLWVADGPQLQLLLDHTRIVRHTDDSGREALISCGAVLDHLRLAMVAAGWQSFVDRFPNPNAPGHLASVDFQRAEHVTEANRRRANAILVRRTDRLPFLAPTDWEVFEAALRELVDDTAVELGVVPDELREDLAEASRLTEETRRYDAEYQSELDWWTAPFELDQGVPRSALNSVIEADRVDVNRAFPAAGHPERRVPTGRDRAKIVVLSTPEDTRSDALATGEALSTVLLECTAVGLATCTVTHMTEVESARKVVKDLVGGAGVPQVLIRVGRIPSFEQAPPATPRRQLTDVLRFRH